MSLQASASWGRGLFRAWVLLSVIWACAVGIGTRPWQYFAYEQAVATDTTENRFSKYDDAGGEIGPWLRYQSERPLTEAQAIAVNGALARRATESAIWAAGVAFLPPIGLLLIFFALRWVAAGFRREAKS